MKNRRLTANEKRRARQWLKRNRPPESWKGTDLEYAETEMPNTNVLCVVALVATVWWMECRRRQLHSLDQDAGSR